MLGWKLSVAERQSKVTQFQIVFIALIVDLARFPNFQQGLACVQQTALSLVVN